MNEFIGKILKITDEITVGANNLPKVSILVQEDKDAEDYKKNSMAIDFLGDKTELVKSFSVGDLVRVGINFKAREAQNGNIYNGITGRRIDALNSSGGSSAPASSGSTDEDLPF